MIVQCVRRDTYAMHAMWILRTNVWRLMNHALLDESWIVQRCRLLSTIPPAIEMFSGRVASSFVVFGTEQQSDD